MPNTPKEGDELYGMKYEIESLPMLEIFFYWIAEPKNWAGVSMEELVSIVVEAALFFRLNPEDQSPIKVYFGDEIPVMAADGKSLTKRTGVTSTVYSQETDLHKESAVV